MLDFHFRLGGKVFLVVQLDPENIGLYVSTSSLQLSHSNEFQVIVDDINYN